MCQASQSRTSDLGSVLHFRSQSTRLHGRGEDLILAQRSYSVAQLEEHGACTARVVGLSLAATHT